MDILGIYNIKNKPLKQGCLIIAEPFLQDDYFERAVLCICTNDADGNFGLIINKPEVLVVKDIIDECPDCEIPIYYGGPMESDTLYILHNVPNLIGGKVLSDNIYFGANPNKLIKALQNNIIKPENIKLIKGYSGWDANQLKSEIEEEAWVVAPCNKHVILSNDTKNIYKNALGLLGNKYKKIATFTKYPELN